MADGTDKILVFGFLSFIISFFLSETLWGKVLNALIPTSRSSFRVLSVTIQPKIPFLYFKNYIPWH